MAGNWIQMSLSCIAITFCQDLIPCVKICPLHTCSISRSGQKVLMGFYDQKFRVARSLAVGGDSATYRKMHVYEAVGPAPGVSPVVSDCCLSGL